MEDTLAEASEQPSAPVPLRPARGRLTLVFIATIAIGLALGNALSAPDTQSGPMVGRIAPEVVADLFDGGQFRLSDHLADDRRPLVLNLWASWCLECREEFPAFSQFSRENPDIAVVGVAVNDQREDAVAFWEETESDFVVGYDATRRLRDSYPGFGLPVTFVIDETGTVIHQLEGGVTIEDLESLFR
jgi:cytochrome c biogenesis protein CcmG/thiol:disulfide interchange protein DsbE